MTVYGADATRPCEKCSKTSTLLDVSGHGLAAYRCPNDHISLVDVSKTVLPFAPVRIPPAQRVLE